MSGNNKIKEQKKVPVKINMFYTLGEELFNSISHGVGALFGVAALVLTVVYAVLFGDVWGVVSSSIYGASMIIMYTMSTLYHSFQLPRVKKIFRIFDHCSIYLLIAGTYTPFTLVTFRGPLGWTLFGIVWGSAILGIVLSSIDLKKYKVFSIICYLSMGWSILFAIKPMIENLPLNGLILLFAGGVCYTGGLVFYKAKHILYAHSLWHLFVLAGSVLHFFSIIFYVLPVKA